MSVEMGGYKPETKEVGSWEQIPGETGRIGSGIEGLLVQAMGGLESLIISGPDLLGSFLQFPQVRRGLAMYERCLADPNIRAGYQPMDVAGFFRLFNGRRTREDWLATAASFVSQNSPLRMVDQGK